MSVGNVYCTYPVNLARYFAKYIAFNVLFFGSFFYKKENYICLYLQRSLYQNLCFITFNTIFRYRVSAVGLVCTVAYHAVVPKMYNF